MFIFRGIDKKESLHIRMENREAHVTWLRSLKEQLKLAGPILGDDGQMQGSMLVLDYKTKEEALQSLAHDHYAKAGLFAQTEVLAYKVVISQF